MDIFQIAAFALCAVILSAALNKYTPWLSVLVSLAAGTVIMLSLMPALREISDSLKTMFSLIDGGDGYVALLFKVIAVSFISQMSSQICTDAGQKAMGDKIEMAARIIIALYTLPLISDMLKLISGFL